MPSERIDPLQKLTPTCLTAGEVRLRRQICIRRVVSHNLDGLPPLQVAAPSEESTYHSKELFLAGGVATLSVMKGGCNEGDDAAALEQHTARAEI